MPSALHLSQHPSGFAAYLGVEGYPGEGTVEIWRQAGTAPTGYGAGERIVAFDARDLARWGRAFFVDRGLEAGSSWGYALWLKPASGPEVLLDSGSLTVRLVSEVDILELKDLVIAQLRPALRLAVGEGRLWLRPGSRVPADGVPIDPHYFVNEPAPYFPRVVVEYGNEAHSHYPGAEQWEAPTTLFVSGLSDHPEERRSLARVLRNELARMVRILADHGYGEVKISRQMGVDLEVTPVLYRVDFTLEGVLKYSVRLDELQEVVDDQVEATGAALEYPTG